MEKNLGWERTLEGVLESHVYDSRSSRESGILIVRSFFRSVGYSIERSEFYAESLV